VALVLLSARSAPSSEIGSEPSEDQRPLRTAGRHVLQVLGQQIVGIRHRVRHRQEKSTFLFYFHVDFLARCARTGWGPRVESLEMPSKGRAKKSPVVPRCQLTLDEALTLKSSVPLPQDLPAAVGGLSEGLLKVLALARYAGLDTRIGVVAFREDGSCGGLVLDLKRLALAVVAKWLLTPEQGRDVRAWIKAVSIQKESCSGTVRLSESDWSLLRCAPPLTFENARTFAETMRFLRKQAPHVLADPPWGVPVARDGRFVANALPKIMEHLQFPKGSEIAHIRFGGNLTLQHFRSQSEIEEDRDLVGFLVEELEVACGDEPVLRPLPRRAAEAGAADSLPGMTTLDSPSLE